MQLHMIHRHLDAARRIQERPPPVGRPSYCRRAVLQRNKKIAHFYSLAAGLIAEGLEQYANRKYHFGHKNADEYGRMWEAEKYRRDPGHREKVKAASRAYHAKKLAART